MSRQSNNINPNKIPRLTYKQKRIITKAQKTAQIGKWQRLSNLNQLADFLEDRLLVCVGAEDVVEVELVTLDLAHGS